jgi:hypothetical protein
LVGVDLSDFVRKASNALRKLEVRVGQRIQ